MGAVECVYPEPIALRNPSRAQPENQACIRQSSIGSTVSNLGGPIHLPGGPGDSPCGLVAIPRFDGGEEAFAGPTQEPGLNLGGFDGQGGFQ